MRSALLCILAVAAAGIAAPAAAVVYVDANLTTGAGDGSSWENAFQGAGGLQAGINAAAGGEVWVAAGTYGGPNVLESGTVLYGGFNNGDAFADRDPATKATIIDGGGTERCLVAVDVQNTVVDGFTLQNGYTAEHGGGYVGINLDNTNAVRNLRILSCSAQTGGGIAFTNSQAIVEDCVVDACESNADGGAGRFESCTGMTVTRCTFSNSVSGGQGGGAISGWGDAAFLDCNFTGNTAGAGGGGLFHIAGASSVDGCTFEGNSATWIGGGLALWDSGAWTVSDSEFSDNVCDAGGGLAAYTSSVAVSGCRFTGNAGYNGSAAALWDLQSAVVSGCEFVGNAATEVVKVVNVAAGQSAMLTNCLFAENDTPGTSGVRHHADAGKGAVHIVNCTLAGNVGGGAPILTSGQAATTILNTVVWGNNPDGGSLDYAEEAAGPTTTVDYSLFEEFPSVDLLDPNPFANGAGNLDQHPQFVDAAGGDYRLLATSPALDTGDAGNALTPDHDLIGDPRPGTIPGVSMGVYEEGVTPATVDVPDVSDLSQADAIAQLEALGFVVDIVFQHNDTLPEGAVIGSSPQAGAGLPLGSTVQLLVSLGAAAEAPPVPVAGTSALLGLGLTLACLAARKAYRRRR